MKGIFLKPCPFCGGKAELKQDTRYPRSGKYEDKAVKAYEVICPNHDCVIYNADNTYFLSKKAAVEVWNSRASGWISVKERLPEEIHRIDYYDKVGGEVSFTESDTVVCRIIYDEKIQYVTGIFTDGQWLLYHDMYNGENEKLQVTHWMPLPELPEMEMRQ